MAKEKPEHVDDPASTDADDDAVRCVACGHALTSRDLRCDQAGSHEHTFVNPAGFVHHIACFVAARGCSYLGEPQIAFSWFPGWSWQIAACGRCRAHVGWLFRCAPDQFHGLIVNAIRM